MRGVARNFVELLTRQNAHGNANLAALVNHPPQTNIFPLFRDADPLEVAPARFERLRNCINSVENIHGDSLPLARAARLRRLSSSPRGTQRNTGEGFKKFPVYFSVPLWSLWLCFFAVC